MLLVILKAKKMLEKINQEEFRFEKVIKKAINYMLNGKATVVLLIAGLIKKIFLYKNELFSTL